MIINLQFLLCVISWIYYTNLLYFKCDFSQLQTTKIFQWCKSEFTSTRRPLPQSVNRFCEFAAKREAGELFSCAMPVAKYDLTCSPIARRISRHEIPHRAYVIPHVRTHVSGGALPLFAHACCDFFSLWCTI